MISSPFTGGKVRLLQEKREVEFRKERIEYDHRYYLCEDTGEAFTTTELDEVNVAQVYDQYCVKHRIQPANISCAQD